MNLKRDQRRTILTPKKAITNPVKHRIRLLQSRKNGKDCVTSGTSKVICDIDSITNNRIIMTSVVPAIVGFILCTSKDVKRFLAFRYGL